MENAKLPGLARQFCVLAMLDDYFRNSGELK